MVNVPVEAIWRSSGESTTWEVVNIPEHVDSGSRGTLTMRWGGPIAVADFLWRRERIVLEVDGYDYHRGRGAFERDHERDAEHQHSDFLVIRATWRQLEDTPEAVLVWVATALARRRGA